MRALQGSARRQPPPGANEDILVSVATGFYIEGRSQGAIARGLGLDPSTVSRYLKRARREGIVRIEIARRGKVDIDLGRQLCTSFGLRRAVVAPVGTDSQTSLAIAAAGYVEGLLRDGLRLGLSWGRTLASVVRYLTPGIASDLVISQLAGGLSEATPGVHGHELVQFVASLYPDSRVHYLHAPVIVDTIAIREAIESTWSIRASLVAAAKSELALVGVGGVDEEATLARGGHISAGDLHDLLARGAVGSMNARFFDASGTPVPLLEERTIAVSWAELPAIPNVVAVAAGAPKVAAIRGALRTKCVDVLITDESTATALLDAG